MDPIGTLIIAYGSQDGVYSISIEGFQAITPIPNISILDPQPMRWTPCGPDHSLWIPRWIRFYNYRGPLGYSTYPKQIHLGSLAYEMDPIGTLIIAYGSQSGFYSINIEGLRAIAPIPKISILDPQRMRWPL